MYWNCFFEVKKRSKRSNVELKKRVDFYQKARFLKLHRAFNGNPTGKVGHFSFDTTRFFLNFSGHTFSVEIKTNCKWNLLKLEQVPGGA